MTLTIHGDAWEVFAQASPQRRRYFCGFTLAL
jgi:hypothetical protein